MPSLSVLEPTARRARNRRRALALVSAPAVLALIVVFVAVWALAGAAVGAAAGMAAGLVVATAAWFGSASSAMRAVGARPANSEDQPRVHNLVEGLCAASGIPKPSILVLGEETSNAMCAGRSPRHAYLVVTSGLVKGLTRVELEGLLAHQLSQIKSGDMVPSTMAVLGLGPVLWLVPGAAVALTEKTRRRAALSDLAAVSVTRYPPGLIAALQKINQGESDGADAGSLLSRLGGRRVAHLWVAPPVYTAGGPSQPVLGARIEALGEL